MTKNKLFFFICQHRKQNHSTEIKDIFRNKKQCLKTNLIENDDFFRFFFTILICTNYKKRLEINELYRMGQRNLLKWSSWHGVSKLYIIFPKYQYRSNVSGNHFSAICKHATLVVHYFLLSGWNIYNNIPVIAIIWRIGKLDYSSEIT